MANGSISDAEFSSDAKVSEFLRRPFSTTIVLGNLGDIDWLVGA